MASDARLMNLGVGLAIRRHRKMRGLSQTGLAVAAGVHLGQLRQMERGMVRAQAPTLARIAIALNCGVADLVITPFAPG